jgi:hypothetical protein
LIHIKLRLIIQAREVQPPLGHIRRAERIGGASWDAYASPLVR